jgi:hypothetical protein
MKRGGSAAERSVRGVIARVLYIYTDRGILHARRVDRIHYRIDCCRDIKDTARQFILYGPLNDFLQLQGFGPTQC